MTNLVLLAINKAVLTVAKDLAALMILAILAISLILSLAAVQVAAVIQLHPEKAGI